MGRVLETGILAAPERGMLAPTATPTRPLRYHFSGIAGAGMNPLAQLMRARGHDVQGSDRALDQGKNPALAAHLRRLGIELAPHDGAAMTVPPRKARQRSSARRRIIPRRRRRA